MMLEAKSRPLLYCQMNDGRASSRFSEHSKAFAMSDLPNLLSDFDYLLPEELIVNPATRESARLLIARQIGDFRSHYCRSPSYAG